MQKKMVFGIFTKILLAMLVVSILPVLGVWFLNYQAALKNSSQQVEERLSASARSLAGEVDGWLEMNQKMLLQNASLREIGAMQGNLQNPILESIVNTYDWNYLAFTVDPDGNNIGRNDGKPLTFYGDREYFQQVVQGLPFGKQVLIGRTSKRPALVLSTAIRSDDDPQLKGVLAIAMTLDDISKRVTDSRIGDTGFAFLLDETGLVIAHASDEYTSTRKDLSAHPAFQASVAGRNQVVFDDERGGKAIAFTHRTQEGWLVVAQQPYAEAYAVLASLNRTAALLLLGAMTLGIVVAVLFSGQLSRPICELTRVADNLSKGKLDVVITGQNRGDEIGALAQAIERLGSSIKYAMERMRKARQNAA